MREWLITFRVFEDNSQFQEKVRAHNFVDVCRMINPEYITGIAHDKTPSPVEVVGIVCLDYPGKNNDTLMSA